MAFDRTVDADDFAMSLTDIMSRLNSGVERLTPEAVEGALKVGQQAWRDNARAVLSASYSRGGWGKVTPGGVVRYKRGPRKGQVKSIKWYGKTYKTGRYARSISHHMLSRGSKPEGEIGSPSMPGLAHLLEKGHGGPGPAGAKPHIEGAYDEAAKSFDTLLDRAIERAIDDA